MPSIPILYIDDETSLLDIGKLYLERTNEFSVITVSSAAEALIRLKTLEVKAIVSDYQMPGIDGIEFLKKVRAKDKRIPFIIFTGKGREEIAVEAFENGADFYLQKGGTPKAQFTELAGKIRAAVEKRAADTKLHESEVRFRALIQNSSDIIRILDKSGIILYDSPSSKRILGYPAGSLVGKNAMAFIHPDDRKRVEADLAEVAGESQKGIPTEFRIRKADGEYVHVESVASNHLKTPGIEGIVVTTRPVTKQKLAQKELDESRERFQQVAENAGEWIWEVDALGMYTYCSPAVQRIIGYSPEELVGKKHFYELFSPNVREALKETALGAFEKKESFRHFENPNLHKDGWTVILDTSGSPVLDRKGTLLGYRGVDQDITERNRAEEELRQAALRWQTTFGATTDAICLLDTDQRILHCNEAMVRLVGKSSTDELTGRHCWEVIHGTTESIPECPIRRLRQSLRREEMKLHLENRWFDVTVDPIFNDRKELTGIVHTVRDITAAKKVEDALNESEERYRSLLDRVPELILIHQNGIIRYANPAMARTLGYQPNEALHRPVTDFITPEFHDRVTTVLKRRTNGETVEPYDLELIGKDGGRRTVIVSGSQVEFEGEPASLVVLTDITERKILEDAVREREQFTKEVISNAKEGIIVYDRNFNYVVWNSFMESLTGIPAGEAQGKNAFDLFPHLKEEKVYLLLQQALKGETIRSPDTPFRVAKTNTSGWVSGIYSPHYNGKGEIIGVIGIVRDITERKQAEEALHQANRQLNLLSSITRHDILNQLLALRGYLDLSRDFLDDPEKMREFLEKEEKAAATIGRQIRFTKEYQGLGVASPVWQNVSESIKKAVASLSMRNVRVECDLPDLEIYADPLFERGFYNLFDNALRHGGEGMTAIHITSSESGTGFTLCCEDNGVGVALEDKNHIFEKGFGKNSGLGLFLVQEILGITGITIMENGELGKGARFEITVPRGGYRFVNT